MKKTKSIISPIKISNRLISEDHEPFLVAEMSGNHNQDLNQALKIVEAAALSGAHAIKLQTYTADTMTINHDQNEFVISDKNSLWYGKTLYDLYQEAHTSWDWHEKIIKKANDLGMICFSTPFDETAVDFLETLNVPCYKVASFEMTDLPLIQKIAKTKKPMIISTGMATISEIDETVRTARNNGCNDIILLRCTSAYPADPANIHLRTIPNMRDSFNCQVGLSDHTLGHGVAVASIAMGATFIEKHFTLDRSAGGVDSQFSLEPKEFKQLTIEVKRAWQSLGQILYGPKNNEKNSLQFRRSLYVVKDMKKGDVFNKENLRAIRPGYGLAPKFYEYFLGKTINQDISKATPLKWEMIG